MQKHVTITLDEDIYEDLSRTAGDTPVSEYIEHLVRSSAALERLDEGYRAMASDSQREADALEWLGGLSGDVRDEAR